MFLTETKIILGISTSDNTNDEILDPFIKRIERKVLNYCNISVIPLSHQYIISEMTASYYNLVYKPSKTSSSSENTGEYIGKISREKIGDYEIDYAESSSSPTSSVIESVLCDYKSELNQIRKLRL